MRHARADYAPIQDGRPESDRIPDDEPVFLLRSKDMLAPAAVDEWAIRVEAHGGDGETARLAFDWAEEMRKYAREHYDGGKLPDAPTALDALEEGTHVAIFSAPVVLPPRPALVKAIEDYFETLYPGLGLQWVAGASRANEAALAQAAIDAVSE